MQSLKCLDNLARRFEETLLVSCINKFKQLINYHVQLLSSLGIIINAVAALLLYNYYYCY